jgi:hypothetical protein
MALKEEKNDGLKSWKLPSEILAAKRQFKSVVYLEDLVQVLELLSSIFSSVLKLRFRQIRYSRQIE